MSNDLGAQLQNALKRAQEKSAEKSPEGIALGMLREELAGILGSAPQAPTKLLPGQRRKSTVRLWADQARLGDQFYDIPAGTSGKYHAMSKENNLKFRTESVLIVHGPFTDPQIKTGTLLTVVEKDGKVLQEIGPPADSDQD